MQTEDLLLTLKAITTIGYLVWISLSLRN